MLVLLRDLWILQIVILVFKTQPVFSVKLDSYSVLTVIKKNSIY